MILKHMWDKAYNMFHRQYMHRMLMDSALSDDGSGLPAKLMVNHKVSWPLRVQIETLKT